MTDIRSLLCALVCGALVATNAGAVDVGERAPSFALPTAAGDSVSLEHMRGRVVYVDFWASWCGPCRRSFPWMNEMQRRYGDKGLSIVAINVDKKRADAARFLSEMSAEFIVVYDAPGAIPAAYAVQGMPSSYLIDPGGNVVAVEQGFRDQSPAALEEKIRALIASRR